jgi:hypothetical protein
MAGKRVKVTAENDTGRNLNFQDTFTGAGMTRAEFVRKIEPGLYPNYHIRIDNGVKTPASNPDQSEGNNLG